MISRKYFVSFLAIVILLGSGIVAFGQTSPVRGTVTLKKADGSDSPAVGIVVDCYRTDSKGKLPSAKTDKKGIFNFAGLTLGQTFALAVSGPGIKSQITPNIKAGMESITISVEEGDGKALTEDEVRDAVLVKPKAGGNTTAPKDDEAARKEKEDFEKKKAEIEEKNRKAADNFATVKKSLDEGRAAMDATPKNYDLAVTKFDEGINADPEFAGSAPVLLNNKALALRLRGFDAYLQSTKDAANKATLLEKTKVDFTGSILASQRAIEVLKTATSTDPNEQKNYAANKYTAIANVVEIHRLLIATKADQTRITEAIAALTAYEAVETDVPQKTKTEIALADALRMAGDSAEALPIYRRVLEAVPDNADAVGGVGLCLFDVGVSTTNKEQMQEGLNFMQRFVDMAPATHPLKASVKDAVDYLKNTEKLTPQKITAPTTTKTTTTKKKP